MKYLLNRKQTMTRSEFIKFAILIIFPVVSVAIAI